MFNVIAGVAAEVGGIVRRAVANLPAGSVSFRVQPEQVYALANRFDAIADDIQASLGRNVFALSVDPPGADKPSVDAAGRLAETGFGAAGLATRLIAYVTELRNAAASLRETGKQYGLTDSTEGGRFGAAGV